MTFTVVNWIDLFIREEYCLVLKDSLEFCRENKGLYLHAYCIMSSHVHLILSAENDLSGVIRDLKSFTSNKLKQVISANERESRREWLLWFFERAGKKNKHNGKFQLWQENFHPIELSSPELLDQRMDYIHNNPLTAGLVSDPCAWEWSSCAAYEEDKPPRIKLDVLQ